MNDPQLHLARKNVLHESAEMDTRPAGLLSPWHIFWQSQHRSDNFNLPGCHFDLPKFPFFKHFLNLSFDLLRRHAAASFTGSGATTFARVQGAVLMSYDRKGVTRQAPPLETGLVRAVSESPATPS